MSKVRVLLAAGLIALVASVSACGSSGDGGGVTLPSITRPERSTTVAPRPTDPPAATTEVTTTTAADGTTTTAADGSTTTEATTTTEVTTTTEAETTTEATTTTEAQSTTEASSTSEVGTSTSVPSTDDLADDTEDDDSTPWWPFALAAVVLLGVVGLLFARRGRKAAALTARTDAALTESADLAAHLAVITPEGAPVVAGPDAARLLALSTELEAISGQTSDEAHQRSLGQVRQQALALHGAVDSVALSAGAPSEAGIALVREQATLLHTATTQARAEILGASGPGAGASATG